MTSASAKWLPPVPFLVACAPKSGEYVSSAYLKADVPGGDSDPSNNINSWDHVTNK